MLSSFKLLFGKQAPFYWYANLSEAAYSAGGTTFSYSFAHFGLVNTDGFQYSDDDGSTWSDFTPAGATAIQEPTPAEFTGLQFVSCTFTINQFLATRKYRVRLSSGPIGNKTYYYSDSARAFCNASECDVFWPTDYSGPVYVADCGLLPELGYIQYMNCNTCSCAKEPFCIASECSDFWPPEYSGPTYVADCGLFPEPGYIKYMDCETCLCAKEPIS
jgi:hypothetical protein